MLPELKSALENKDLIIEVRQVHVDILDLEDEIQGSTQLICKRLHFRLGLSESSDRSITG